MYYVSFYLMIQMYSTALPRIAAF